MKLWVILFEVIFLCSVSFVAGTSRQEGRERRQQGRPERRDENVPEINRGVADRNEDIDMPLRRHNGNRGERRSHFRTGFGQDNAQRNVRYQESDNPDRQGTDERQNRTERHHAEYNNSLDASDRSVHPGREHITQSVDNDRQARHESRQDGGMSGPPHGHSNLDRNGEQREGHFTDTESDIIAGAPEFNRTEEMRNERRGHLRDNKRNKHTRTEGWPINRGHDINRAGRGSENDRLGRRNRSRPVNEDERRPGKSYGENNDSPEASDRPAQRNMTQSVDNEHNIDRHGHGRLNRLHHHHRRPNRNEQQRGGVSDDSGEEHTRKSDRETFARNKGMNKGRRRSNMARDGKRKYNANDGPGRGDRARPGNRDERRSEHPHANNNDSSDVSDRPGCRGRGNRTHSVDNEYQNDRHDRGRYNRLQKSSRSNRNGGPPFGSSDSMEGEQTQSNESESTADNRGFERDGLRSAVTRDEKREYNANDRRGQGNRTRTGYEEERTLEYIHGMNSDLSGASDRPTRPGRGNMTQSAYVEDRNGRHGRGRHNKPNRIGQQRDDNSDFLNEEQIGQNIRNVTTVNGSIAERNRSDTTQYGKREDGVGGNNEEDGRPPFLDSLSNRNRTSGLDTARYGKREHRVGGDKTAAWKRHFRGGIGPYHPSRQRPISIIG